MKKPSGHKFLRGFSDNFILFNHSIIVVGALIVEHAATHVGAGQFVTHTVKDAYNRERTHYDPDPTLDRPSCVEQAIEQSSINFGGGGV